MCLRSFLSLSLVSFILAGCGRSGSSCGDGMTATLSMGDTAVSYDIWLEVRTPARVVADSLVIAVDIEAPEGMAHSFDTLVVPLGRDLIASGSLKGIRSCSSVLSYDVEVLYRTGVRPVWPGEWKFSFSAEPPIAEEIWARAEIAE